MRITLSVALTADGWMDDTAPARLRISTPGDWEEVHRLRAAHDAILVGASTLRRDNPALRLRDAALRGERLAAGMPADLIKVSLTESGRLDPSLRFFTEGAGEKILFARRQLPELDGAATVVVCDEGITARRVVTELERRGVRSLFVEGGARVLRMFLDEGMADTVRVAVNPALRVGERGYARFRFTPPAGCSFRCERVDGMEVTTCTLHPDTTAGDLHYLRQAVAESRRCTPCATSYCVGAVVVTAAGEVFAGYTHETSPTRHAEQEAIAKAEAAGAVLRGATMFSSMEPCSTRRSEPESCSQLLIRCGFARAVFALYEPSHFVACCRGALALREAGLDVRCYAELADAVREVNGHLLH